MDPWVAAEADRIATTAVRDLTALVAVSSPSGDIAGAEAAVAVVLELLPTDAMIERLPCSTPGFADDLVVRLTGTGDRRVVLVGHLDTVVGHADHRPLDADPADATRLLGSGSVDMKGGDVLAIGVLNALATRRADFAEVVLLLVCDEEWRTRPFVHAGSFTGFDACLCFEAGELDADGRDAVVVRRKAAGSIKVVARGRRAHSGARPDDGRNALLAAADVAQRIAALHDPNGPDRLTAVPTVLTAGDALNVVPDHAELLCDVRADSLDAVESVLAVVPTELDGVALSAENLRRWPGMDAREASAAVLERAGAVLGSPIVPASRGGASDASHFAATISITIDGLGPLGGDAHAPGEWVSEPSLRSRAAVALAVVGAVLDA